MRWNPCIGALVVLGGCASAPEPEPPEPLPPPMGAMSPQPPENPVTPGPVASGDTVALVGGTLLDGRGNQVEDGVVVFADGRLTAVGPRGEVSIPSGATRIDVSERYVTPGLVDTHSHMGVYAHPFVDAHADGNEMSDPATPYVFSEHGFWPQDPAIQTAVIGGVTTIQVLPGSGNVIGGRSVTLKLRPTLESRAMRFPGAPFGLKMACGENPKRYYGQVRGRQPMSRMGNIYQLRQAFMKAREYAYRREAYEREYAKWERKRETYEADRTKPEPGKEPGGPERNLGYETLAAVLAKEIEVHIHCYRADEMLLMLSLADELGYQVSTFHHAVEAYKIADVLAARGVHAAVWADWWGFKMEAYDATEANAAILHAAGGKPNIHSDSSIGIQRLNQEAAKALAAGRRHGLEISDPEAIRWITSNPAEALGIAKETGTLEAGKMADVVVWDRTPLSIYARTTHVFIDGELVFDRESPGERWSDFLVGSEVEAAVP